MHKARQEMAKVLPQIDLVLEVLDARIPYSSENPMLAELAGNKPILRVLTRADLADPELTTIWLDAYSDSLHRDAMALCAKDPDSIKEVPERLKAMFGRTASSRYKPRVAMIVGIPNVGKSTLINTMTGRAIAKTGNEPAITRRQQLISLNEAWSLRDTPGVLWPKVENEASGFRLAATGAIRDTAMNSADVAAALLDYLIVAYPDFLRSRYGQSLPLAQSVETLEAIGLERGCMGGGGLVDFDRSGRLVLQEFRSGRLGRITLETPTMRKKEIAETERRMAELAQKREKKKNERARKRAARKRRSN